MKYFKNFFVLAFLCFFIFSLSLAEETIDSFDPDKILGNDDIVSLVRAGLSDEAVIALIQKSETQFDLSPDALIKLSNTGVSNAVIEVMIKSQSLDKSLSRTSLIPTAYGYYVIDDDKLIKLERSPVVTKVGLPLRIGGLGYAMDGLGVM